MSQLSAMSLPPQAISVRGAEKHYKDKTVLHAIDLAISTGETVAIVGPNGAGKTTLIESIIGLRELDGGEITVLGEAMSPQSAKKISHKIGIQLQETKMFSSWTVNEYIQLFSTFYKKTADIEALIDELSLRDHLYTTIGKLSGGYKQRLSLVLSVLNDPDIIILDEPTTGLDPLSRKELWGCINRLKEKNKTIILSTHYMEEIRYLCDRVILISNGKIVANDSPDQLIARTPTENATLDDAYLYFTQKLN